MSVKLFTAGRVSLKNDDPRPAAIAGGQANDWIKSDVLSRMKAKAKAAPIAEPIEFAASDVAQAYGITTELAGEIIASLVRSLMIVPKVDGYFGTHAGYTLGQEAK